MPTSTPAKPVTGTYPRAIDLFTDREPPQQAFAEAREDLAPDR